MEQIGIEAILKDDDFQTGLSAYTAGLAKMERTTAQALKSIGVLWDEQNKTFRKGGIAISENRVAEELNKLKSKFTSISAGGGVTIPVKADVSGVTNAVAQIGPVIQSVLSGDIIGAFSQMRMAITGIGTAFAGASASAATFAAVVGTVAVAVAALVAVAAVVKVGIDSFREWAGQVADLQELLGMTAQEASSFAVAGRMVGMTVDDMSGSFGYLIRSLGNAQVGMQNAEKQIAEATSQAADQTRTVWSDLADNRLKIQEALARSIASVESGLQRNLADMAHSYGKQLEQFARDERAAMEDAAKALGDIERQRVKSLAEVDEDAAKSLAKLQLETTKSLAKVDSNLKDALRNSRSAKERRALRREAAERKQEILTEAAERKKEIEEQAAERKKDIEEQAAERRQQIIEQRNERLVEIAERRKEAAEQFEYQKQQARELAAMQIAEQRRASAEQIKAAEEAAAKQAAAIAKALSTQTAKLKETSLTDPILRGLKTLGISAEEAFALMDKPFELFKRIAEQYSKMPEGMERSKALFDIFGRGGAKMNELMEKGPAFFAFAEQVATASGLMLTEEDIQRYKDAEIEFNKLGITLDGLKVKIGATAIAQGNAADETVNLSNMWQKAGDTIQTVGTIWDYVSKRAMVGWQNLGDKIRDESTDATGVAKDKFKDFGDTAQQVADEFKRNWDDAIDAIERAWDDLTRAARDKVNEIYTTVTNTWTEIQAWLSQFSLFNVGANLLQTFIDGITSKVSSLQTLWNSIQNTLGGKSPTTGSGNGGWGVGSRDVMPSFDLGGWMRRTGPALLHAGEYVLNPMQARLMAPVLTSPNYSRTTYNFSHTWNGGTGTMDRREIERIVETATYRSIRQVVGAG